MTTQTQSNGLSWNSLFLTGSVVDIDAGRWYARTKIKPEDLGIVDSPEVAKALSLGSHRLAPPEAFEEIQGIVSRAKRALEFHSLKFAMIAGARYVPSDQMEPLMMKLREAKRQYKDALERFVANYDSVIAAMLPTIKQALTDAAKGDMAVVDQALARIQSEYPSSDQIRAKFYFKWSIYAVQSAKGAAAAEAAEEEAESIKGVVKGMVEQLRTDLAEKVSGVMEVIKKGGKLKKNSLAAALTCLDRTDSLNVLGDLELTRQTRAIREALMNLDPETDAPAGTVDQLGNLKSELEQGAAEAVAQAEQALMGLGVRKLVV